MVFSSVIFLFYYLPLVLLLYHLVFLPVSLGWRPGLWRRLANLLLLLASLLFYAWGEDLLVWIVITSTLIDYCCALLIARGFLSGPVNALIPGGPRSRWQRAGLILSIVSNLCFLGYFKYFNFFVGSFNQAMASVGLDSWQWQHLTSIALPLGISFYTFQSMSYTIDVYRGMVPATRNLIDFACYVTMFPQLVAGPIVRYRDVASQLVSRVISRQGFALGVRRFVIGLAKKMLIANTTAQLADAAFAIPAGELTPALAWLGIFAYSLQIYFDFSGYSDMAIGLGHMLGFEYRENFDYPYIALSVRDFWRRWHISLSTWFRDYLFIPLGGSKASPVRTYTNLVTVFFLCGLWHGAAWSFVAWGLLHGLFLVLERLGLARLISRLPRPLRHGYTLLVAIVGWVLFRAETLAQGLHYLAAMLGLSTGKALLHPVARYLSPEIALLMIIGIVGSAPVIPALMRWLRGEAGAGWQRPVTQRALPWLSVLTYGALMILSAMRLAAGSFNPFIYFRF